MGVSTLTVFHAALRRAFVAAGLTASCLCAQATSDAVPAAPADTTGEMLEFQPAPSPVLRSGAPLAPMPEDPRASAREDRLRALQRRGDLLYTAGTISAVGGIAGMLAAVNFDQPALGQASVYAYLVGLPVLGVGAGQVYKAHRLRNPGVGGDGRHPWFLYGLGWGSQFLGATLAYAGAVQMVGDLFTGEEESGDGVGLMMAGMGFIFAGATMHMVSWYQFSERRADAKEGLSLSLEPMVPINSRGYADGAGLRLRARF